ncbi:hypothetical protein QBC44DRAFT_401748 [Cladorrhinum sp. PSN332]|nr:hypothetical protein QBC44DRAFT_401748 [Cladorrhinum sp. PSN332]
MKDFYDKVHRPSTWDPLSYAPEWLSLPIQIGSNTTTLTPEIRLTLCTMDPHARTLSITAARPKTVPEPSVTWDLATRSFNTSALQPQFGGTGSSLRGVFDITSPTSSIESWSVIPEKFTDPPRGMWGEPLYGETPGFDDEGSRTVGEMESCAFQDLSWSIFSHWEIWLCVVCSPVAMNRPRSGEFAPQMAVDVFQRMLQDTNNIALAVQGLVTNTFSMAYYDLLPHFDLRAPVELTTTLEVDMPVSDSFAILMSTLLVVHLLLVTLVTVFFLKHADTTLLGNAWSAVSQLVGPDTETWLAVASRKTDGEVEREMKRAGEKNILVGVGDCDGQLRVRRRAGDKV